MKLSTTKHRQQPIVRGDIFRGDTAAEKRMKYRKRCDTRKYWQQIQSQLVSGSRVWLHTWHSLDEFQCFCWMFNIRLNRWGLFYVKQKVGNMSVRSRHYKSGSLIVALNKLYFVLKTRERQCFPAQPACPPLDNETQSEGERSYEVEEKSQRNYTFSWLIWSIINPILHGPLHFLGGEISHWAN